MVDVEIYGRGFYTIQSGSTRGARWLRRVEGFDGYVAYCDDTRLTEAIARGAIQSGLQVRVNGARVELNAAEDVVVGQV